MRSRQPGTPQLTHSRSIVEFDHIRRESRRAGGKEGEIKKREREIARLFLYPMGEEGAPLVSQAPSDSRLGPEMRIIMISGRVAVPTRCRAGVLDSYGGSRPWHPSPTPSPLRWKLSSTTRHVEGASQGNCSKRITGSSSVGCRCLLAARSSWLSLLCRRGRLGDGRPGAAGTS